MTETMAASHVLTKRRIILYVVFAIGAVALFAVPLFTPGYGIRLATSLCMLIGMGQAWNLLGGYTGYVSFGHVAFFGVGAYSTAILMNIGLDFFLAAICGALIAVLLAVLVGLPVLRLHGHYFAVATFAMAEAVRHLVNTLSITGGGKGLTFPLPSGDIVDIDRSFYAMMLALMLVVTVVVALIVKRPFGFALIAIREDEGAAKVMGIRVSRFKNIAFMLSALFVGLFGSIYGYWVSYIDPGSAFDVVISIELVLVVMLGGAGRIFGPIIGGVIYFVAAQVLVSQFLELHTMFLGIMLVLIMLFLPRGVMDLFSEDSRRRGLKDALLANIREKGI